jgi:hypothetical protein
MVKSGPVQKGRGKLHTANLEQLRQNRIKHLEEQLTEAIERESGEGGESETKKGKWVTLKGRRKWVPSGQEGANFMDIDPTKSFLATLHGGEEVIEAKEVLALQRVTELAKSLIEQFGKGGEYWIKHEGARYRAKGDTKTGEGAAFQAVKMMAKLGATNFEHIFQRERDVYGKMKIDRENMVQGRQRNEARDLMGNAMPGLIEQFGGIRGAKLQLADMAQGGYRIPFEATKFNTTGNQLNNAAYDKVGLRGQGNVINAPTINAPTSVSNTTIAPKRLSSPYAPSVIGENRGIGEKRGGDKFLS